jgi:tRNA1(Val) A37 N6-methylase TrmN6
VSAPGRTTDGFLDNRLRIDQPRDGFRAGHDSVLLAAAVPARASDTVLELGSGTGVASLCLAARVACSVLGVEIDPELVVMANENAARNGMAPRVRFVAADVGDFVPEGARFDHAFFNPPFHPPAGHVSPVPARDRATRDSDDALAVWTRRACELIASGGSVTLILRADRFEAWGEGARGAIEAIPLLARRDGLPKRIIATLRPGGPAGLVLRPPVVLHREDGRPTEAAEAVLRRGAGLA